MRVQVFVCACFALITASFAVVLAQDGQDFTRVQLNYDLKLERLIELGGYDRVDPYINSNNFPAPRVGFDEIEAAFIYFEDPVATGIVRELAASQGWRLGNAYELLTIGVRYSDLQRKYPLVALGSVATDEYGVSSVAYLWGDENERTVNRGWPGNNWHPICRFLVVKEKPAETPMCIECASRVYAAVLTPFACQNCTQIKEAPHAGNWHYCNNCARKLSRCAMCGKKM